MGDEEHIRQELDEIKRKFYEDHPGSDNLTVKERRIWESYLRQRLYEKKEETSRARGDLGVKAAPTKNCQACGLASFLIETSCPHCYRRFDHIPVNPDDTVDDTRLSHALKAPVSVAIARLLTTEALIREDMIQITVGGSQKEQAKTQKEAMTTAATSLIHRPARRAVIGCLGGPRREAQAAVGSKQIWELMPQQKIQSAIGGLAARIGGMADSKKERR